jgi:hypothetical protein
MPTWASDITKTISPRTLVNHQCSLWCCGFKCNSRKRTLRTESRSAECGEIGLQRKVLFWEKKCYLLCTSVYRVNFISLFFLIDCSVPQLSRTKSSLGYCQCHAGECLITSSPENSKLPNFSICQQWRNGFKLRT